MVNNDEVERETLRKLPSETHSSEFAKSIKRAKEKGVEFSQKEQNDLAIDIIKDDTSSKKVGGVIEKKVFEKQHPKTKDKPAPKKNVKSFDSLVLSSSDDMLNLSEKLDVIIQLKDELKNFNLKQTTLANRALWLESMKSLERKITIITDFLKTSFEKTEDVINEQKLIN